MYLFVGVALAAVVFPPSASAFDPLSKNNVITYWGQGPNQQRLIETCQNPSYDIINIGFVDVFPDQGPGGFPGTNFGNACWGDTYNNSAGVPTDLLKTCPYISPDVIACQQTYGKKIFLSIGGGNPNNYYITNDTSGESFADFLWAAFGPVSATQSTIPRPWGNAVVDGFDFDTENLMSPAPISNYMTSGYVAMINHLKNDLFPTDTSKNYYISGAPQCAIPDPHFTSVISSAWFDFLWIQFYNTPSCSARAAINYANGEGSSDISFSTWEQSASLNPNVRMSIGLPANTGAATDPSYYLTPAEVQTVVAQFYNSNLFGGIMLWEATYAMNNVICGSDYGTWMETILSSGPQGPPVNISCQAGQTTTSNVQTTTTGRTTIQTATLSVQTTTTRRTTIQKATPTVQTIAKGRTTVQKATPTVQTIPKGRTTFQKATPTVQTIPKGRATKQAAAATTRRVVKRRVPVVWSA